MQGRIARIAILGGLLSVVLPAGAQELSYRQTNLVSDVPGMARFTDPNLVNPWGISESGGGPFWISNNGTHTSTLYNTAGAIIPLVVTIPGEGSVTGQVFNSSADFNHDVFLFVSEDGAITGWRGTLGTNAETLAPGSSANVYKGSAIGTIGTNHYLYAANFRTGHIDVVKGNGAAPSLTGTFTDSALPAGYAPFNIQNLGGKLYVTYAKQDAALHDEVDGAGNGFVDVFDLNGNLLQRLVAQGSLDSPWGLATAPSNFGKYSNDLLVGNFGDGKINAFDPTSGAFLGALQDEIGNTLAIDGLWGLQFGNGGAGGDSNKLYFTAGLNGETHGLFGSLQSVPEPGPVCSLLLGTLTGAGWLLRRRRRA